MSDDPEWISKHLREAGNIIAGDGHTCSARASDRLLFALADVAESLEKSGIYPMRDPGLDMVFANAVIFASGVIQEFNDEHV